MSDGGWPSTFTFSIALESFDILGGYGIQVSCRPEHPGEVGRLDRQVAMVRRPRLRATEGSYGIGDRDPLPLPQEGSCVKFTPPLALELFCHPLVDGLR